MFQNGLPADFRLVGATTKTPDDVSPALRSRCLEVFFGSLSADEVGIIAEGAAVKAGVSIDERAVEMVRIYGDNGRDPVNLVQLGAGAMSLSRGQSKRRRWGRAPRCEPQEHGPLLG